MIYSISDPHYRSFLKTSGSSSGGGKSEGGGKKQSSSKQ
jgi:hypothetical protein